MFGIKQSGVLEFAIADVFRDADIMKQASEAAQEILSLDFSLELPQNERLKDRLKQYTSRQIDNLGI